METQHSDKSISEIVATSNEDIADPYDEESAAASAAHVTPDKYFIAELHELGDKDSYAPSVQKAREAANIPPHFPVKDLVSLPILVWSKTAQKAALPETGELRDGFFCVCRNEETKKPFTTWIGQTALVRDLSQLILPFKTTIVKHGRTYRFE